MDTKKRSWVKSITWRILAVISTTIIALVLTKDWALSLQIGIVNLFISTLLYYLHERVWNKIKWETK